MKVLHTLLFLIFVSCARSPLKVYTSASKESVFHKDGLWKISSEKVEILLESQEELHVRALLMCHEQKTDEALSLIFENFKSTSKDNEIYNIISVCHILNKDYEKALLAVEKGLALERKNKKLLLKLKHNKALIFHKIGHFNEARTLYTEVLEKAPNLYTTSFNLGLLYLQFNLTQEALAQLEPLMNIAPKDIDLLSSIALIHALEGRYNKALSLFELIDMDSRQREDIALYYAVSLVGAKRFEEAKVVLKNQNVPFIKEIRLMSRKLQDMVDTKLQTIASK
ncbi:tetratricopeptide repeat protein [Halobacteriovorax sp. GB3]|uniref:tetratricopeptide repeat protein n=1 Tax=Halobacteriovorax sp. GB3 TaxID=2719615 RepID=UPI0023620B78|nr:tetratricopeptide repeat protein [Halobacteriovorax sp. GB3]MDD0853419.1 tetratricopeptide repeat protein [Halobacteriovorax sp. GB3]